MKTGKDKIKPKPIDFELDTEKVLEEVVSDESIDPEPEIDEKKKSKQTSQIQQHKKFDKFKK